MKYYIYSMLFASMLCAQVVRQQVSLEGNYMRSFIWNTGVFNQNLNTNNAGCEWPKSSGKYLVYTSGLNIAAYINNELRMISSSYRGECVPGYSLNGAYFTDNRFKFYIIRKGDNFSNNPDWLNWGLMVPYGAPFNDVNNNGIYEYYIDTPGVKSASQTIFICMTDGDTSQHNINEGFGGGTKPLFAEIHLTAWCYDNYEYKDMQFFKWQVINRNSYPWEKTYFSYLGFNMLGFADDNFTGCDTLRNLSYCYNCDNDDFTGFPGSYGINPPAYGISLLNCNSGIKMTSSVYMLNTSTPGPTCEKEVYSSSSNAYNIMKGFKNDGTSWVLPDFSPPRTTKFCYSGEPETQTGWTEFQGKIDNCGGTLNGNYTYPNIGGKRYSVMSYGSESLTISQNDSINLFFVQLAARGNNFLNSVTRLKELTDKAHELCQNGFVIGINQIFNEIPTDFNLYQNYPNPFNPATTINFSIPKSQFVTLKIYDALGREIATLVNDRVAAGVYSVEWDAAAYPSGIYFYSINAGNFIQTRKMMLIK